MAQAVVESVGAQVLPDTKPSPLEYALAYARLGWPVLPVEPGPSKRPWKGNGIEHATTDAAQIRQWFEGRPELNIGIHLAPAGLMAVDFDPRNGAQLEWAQELPSTLTAETGGGGLHLIYRVPPGRVPPGTLGPGVDVKHRGYIVAAPSKHASGQVYAFEGWDPLSGTEPQIGEAPECVLSTTLPQASPPADNRTTYPLTNSQISELRSALNFIRADDRADWIAMGMALRCLGDAGRELWLTWSQTSEKFQPRDALTWNTFNPTALHCDYRSVFAEAQRRGWVNPSSAAAQIAAPAATQPAPASEPIERQPFQLVPLLGHIAHAAPTFVWHLRIPRRVVTLWTSHGGLGKTTINLQLGICCALGLPLFGVPTTQCDVVIFSAEDEGGLMRHRLDHLCRCMGVDPAQLEGKLFILDATSSGEPTLFVEVTTAGRKVGATTATYDALREFIRGKDIGLLVLDNASDVFEEDEIKRVRVRAFMRSLTAIAREFDLAVVLLAHVDKKTARGEAGGSDSYSGSTAWHNSARSRLALLQKQGNLVLVHEKWNLSSKQPDLVLTWPVDGIPTLADAVATTAARGLIDRIHLKALLRLIHAHSAEGKYVTPSNNSRSAAAVVLKGKDGYPATLDSVGVEQLLKEALADGYLRIDPHKSADGHRNGGKHWALTPAGLELAGITNAEVGSGN